MNIVGIIPARLASTRFPGKPLAKICGIPMLGHVYLRSKMSKSLTDIYVATCDQKIQDYIENLGGKCVMTQSTHERATDRTAEAMLKIEKKLGRRIDIVAMVQGDEPMIFPEMINLAVAPLLADKHIQVVNLVTPLKTKEEHEDPHEVKVVVDQEGFALYFSREPIPSRKKCASEIIMLKQVCVITFRRNFLLKFNNLAPTPLENIESIDMLRILEHGFRIKTIFSPFDTYSVDTSEDLHKVEELMKCDTLMKKYTNKK